MVLNFETLVNLSSDNKNVDEEHKGTGTRTLLAHHLQIPATFRCHQRFVCDGTEGLCMLLRRLSYLCTYKDLIPRFGRTVPVLSMVTNTVLDYIYDHHGHRITQWNNAILNPPQLERYADAIAAQGAPLDNCFGFFNGTVRPICCPGQNQRIVYNGHKRVHALKFQSVALRNGIIGNLYGPVGKCFRKPKVVFFILILPRHCFVSSPPPPRIIIPN